MFDRKNHRPLKRLGSSRDSAPHFSTVGMDKNEVQAYNNYLSGSGPKPAHKPKRTGNYRVRPAGWGSSQATRPDPSMPSNWSYSHTNKPKPPPTQQLPPPPSSGSSSGSSGPSFTPIKPTMHDVELGHAVIHGGKPYWTGEYAEKLYGKVPPPPSFGSSIAGSGVGSGYNSPFGNSFTPVKPQSPISGSGPKPYIPDITQSEHIFSDGDLHLYHDPVSNNYFFAHSGAGKPPNTFSLGELSGQDYWNNMVHPADFSDEYIQNKPKPQLMTDYQSAYVDLINKVRDAWKTDKPLNPYDYDLLALEYQSLHDFADKIAKNHPELSDDVYLRINNISRYLDLVANKNKYDEKPEKPVSLGGDYTLHPYAATSQLGPIPQYTLNQLFHYDPEHGYINPVYHINQLAEISGGNLPDGLNTYSPTPSDNNTNDNSGSNQYSGGSSYSGYSRSSYYNRPRSYVTYRKYAEEIAKDPSKLGTLPKNVFAYFYKKHKSSIERYINNPTFANRLGLVNDIKRTWKLNEY